MGEVRGDDDRTFNVNFAGEGGARLRERVKEKLKEFMGDYTDDTLVNYVFILLGNGRNKYETKKELNVFLDDDSDSFVSWLWDHLSLNLHLYIQSKELLLDEMPIGKITKTGQFGRFSSQAAPTNGSLDTYFKRDDGKRLNISSRRNRDWKCLVGEKTESFPLRRVIIEALHSGEEISKPLVARRSLGPRPFRRKRSQKNVMRPMKRDSDSFPKVPKLCPPRRIFEFAVRDAVKTVHDLSPELKQLRSGFSLW